MKKRLQIIQSINKSNKKRLRAEGNETVTNCHALRMRTSDDEIKVTEIVEKSATTT